MLFFTGKPLALLSLSFSQYLHKNDIPVLVKVNTDQDQELAHFSIRSIATLVLV